MWTREFTFAPATIQMIPDPIIPSTGLRFCPSSPRDLSRSQQMPTIMPCESHNDKPDSPSEGPNNTIADGVQASSSEKKKVSPSETRRSKQAEPIYVDSDDESVQPVKLDKREKSPGYRSLSELYENKERMRAEFFDAKTRSEGIKKKARKTMTVTTPRETIHIITDNE